ncbi:transcriptional regulator [Bifidobacterium avesanii]|nr:transcriptional regulator [Bifidobacterium avesanii]
MEVLFVSDDLPLAQAVRRVLEANGHACTLMTGDGRVLRDEAAETTDGGTAEAPVSPNGTDAASEDAAAGPTDPSAPISPDLVIVDDSSRGWTSERFATLMAGYPHARSLLLVQSAVDGTSTPPDGDGLEPDAVLRMPFSNAELVAHVASLRPDAKASRLLIHGDLTLDLGSGRAYYGESRKPLPLSPREFATLKTLIEADGRFLTFDELGRAVCGTGFFGYHDIMNNVLYSLTRKLRRLGFFVTQRGKSYRIL